MPRGGTGLRHSSPRSRPATDQGVSVAARQRVKILFYLFFVKLRYFGSGFRIRGVF
ncbi:hypothetical protein HanRHA438_Chr02g0067181 [Helianthus annuus]|nr:hypothetical protein HanRHA438_Chr02g0067181 [Helianthus annuus]